MKKILLSVCAGLLSPCTSAYAYESIHSDDIVVTASRVAQSRENVLADISVIEQEEIERAGQSTLIELLQRQPGVEISSNGGAGKTSSVYLRGTNSDHIVVLVDGLRLNSATTGSFAFESLPLGQIERIEILRGPAASLYGADAIGGVIQIFTRRGDGPPRLQGAAGYGRYNTRQGEAGISGNAGGLRYAINASASATDGFSAKKTDSGFDKDSDPYRNQSASASLSYEFTPGHELQLQLFSSEGKSDYDCNKPVCNIDQSLLSYGLTSRNRLTDFWRSTLQLGMGVDDSTNNATTFRSVFRTEQRQYAWQNDLTLPLGTLTLAYDRLEQRIGGSTDYAVKSRDNNGWLASYVLNHGHHDVQASMRLDDNSQYGEHATGNLAYGYRLTPQWRISAGYGTAFKAPSFNQLFYPGFGNPDLEPERSRNLEAALRYEGSRLRLGVTLFENHVRNLIENSGPAGDGCTFAGFCPVNVGRAEIRGATLEGRWHASDSLALYGNFTTQSPRNEETGQLLTRRGNRHGTVGLLHRRGDFEWGAELSGSSTRYNDANNSKKMAGYATLSLTANYRIAPAWRLEARADNVLDKDYVLAYTGNSASAVAYETAGANLFIGLRWQPQ